MKKYINFRNHEEMLELIKFFKGFTSDVKIIPPNRSTGTESLGEVAELASNPQKLFLQD